MSRIFQCEITPLCSGAFAVALSVTLTPSFAGVGFFIEGLIIFLSPVLSRLLDTKGRRFSKGFQGKKYIHSAAIRFQRFCFARQVQVGELITTRFFSNQPWIVGRRRGGGNVIPSPLSLILT